MVVDVSCDPNSPYNPLPFYNSATTFDLPCERVKLFKQVYINSCHEGSENLSEIVAVLQGGMTSSSPMPVINFSFCSFYTVFPLMKLVVSASLTGVMDDGLNNMGESGKIATCTNIQKVP